ncbi:MAG: hypothetical protein QUV07_00430 [Cyanobium sp. CZS 25K]|nr:hypothetical protein [Cyanobium sp. CZS25K]
MSSDPSLFQLMTLLISSIGLGYTIYGKKQARAVALGCGVLLMVVPYGIRNLPLLLLVALALMLLPFFLHRLIS